MDPVFARSEGKADSVGSETHVTRRRSIYVISLRFLQIKLLSILIYSVFFAWLFEKEAREMK